MEHNITDTELEIMKVLWASEKLLTEKEIRSVIEQSFDWKKQTTQTLIRRLVEKGVILREKRDIYYHSPAVSRDEVEKNGLWIYSTEFSVVMPKTLFTPC